MNTPISSSDLFIRLFSGISMVILITLIPVTEAFSDFTSSRQFTTGQFLKIYNTGDALNSEGRVVSDNVPVYAYFRYRNWSDGFEWVSTRINDGPESARTSMASVQHIGDTVDMIPVNVSGHCGEIEVVLWTGRRNASPVKSDPFRLYVDCESPRITVRAYETTGSRGGTLVSPRELTNGECTIGRAHRFDVRVQDNIGIREVSSKLEGPVQGTSGERTRHYVSTALEETGLQQGGSTRRATRSRGTNRDVLTERWIRYVAWPSNDTPVTLTVYVTELSGQITTKQFSITLGGASADNLITRIERPRDRSLKSSGERWEISGRVTSQGCAATPDRVTLYNTIPGGRERELDETRVDSSGRFSFIIPSRTAPVGTNKFRVKAKGNEGRLQRGLHENSDSIEVSILAIKQDTINKVIQPPANYKHLDPDSVRAPLPGASEPETDSDPRTFGSKSIGNTNISSADAVTSTSSNRAVDAAVMDSGNICTDLKLTNIRVTDISRGSRGYNFTLRSKVKNISETNWRSNPGQQGVYVYKGGVDIHNTQFTDIRRGAEIDIEVILRNWRIARSSLPDYLFRITYAAGINDDGNNKNDDCNTANNSRTISGTDIKRKIEESGR